MEKCKKKKTKTNKLSKNNFFIFLLKKKKKKKKRKFWIEIIKVKNEELNKMKAKINSEKHNLKKDFDFLNENYENLKT